MTQNEDFNLISQIAVLNNEDVDNMPDGEIENDIDDLTEEDEIGEGSMLQVPSTYTNLEETNFSIDDNWIGSLSENKCDFTRELGKDFFKDKDELTRAVKLYNIKAHKHFEVVESRPTTWCIRCMLHKQGCKWQLRASKRKRSGAFEITKYIGPHTCLHYNISQDHPNLDSTLIAQEIQHLIKEQPSISITALKAEIVDKLGYTPSYKKVWVGKQKAIEYVFGNWEESYIMLPKYLYALQKFNPGTIVEWCVLEQAGIDHVEFRRVFWAFDPSIKGFIHCRPVISIGHLILKGARFLPITACVQLTFYRLVNYYDVRRPMGSNAQANGDVYTPHVVAKQAALMSKAGAHSLRSFNRQKGIFEVITQKGRNVQVVNLEQQSCTCGKWEIFKYPCSHVLSVCAKLSLNTWQYIHNYYSIEAYCATWASEFFPLPHEAYWPRSSSMKELLPNSDLKRDKKGRPRSTRLRNGMDIKEGKKSNNCGICGQPGHNRATCPSKRRKIDA